MYRTTRRYIYTVAANFYVRGQTNKRVYGASRRLEFCFRFFVFRLTTHDAEIFSKPIFTADRNTDFRSSLDETEPAADMISTAPDV